MRLTPSSPRAAIASRIDLVVATTRPSGLPPTAIPFVGATASNKLVGGGSESEGHGVGRNLMWQSLSTPLKPISYRPAMLVTKKKTLNNGRNRAQHTLVLISGSSGPSSACGPACWPPKPNDMSNLSGLIELKAYAETLYLSSTHGGAVLYQKARKAELFVSSSSGKAARLLVPLKGRSEG